MQEPIAESVAAAAAVHELAKAIELVRKSFEDAGWAVQDADYRPDIATFAVGGPEHGIAVDVYFVEVR